jgi:hypothetical protein
MLIDSTSSSRSSNSSATGQGSNSQGSDIDNEVLHSALDENGLH